MQKKYSEQDIQDYASGHFTGDNKAFEDFLRTDPRVEAQVKMYQELYRVLAADSPPSLSFNLADRVVEQVQQKAYSSEPNRFGWLNYFLIILLASAVIISVWLLDFPQIIIITEGNLFFVSALAIVLFVAAFHIVELKQREKNWAELNK